MGEAYGRLLVISGPSGVGKGTLCRHLLAMAATREEASPGWQLSVSMTSRPPRDGEMEGVDYFFSSEAQFQNAIAQGALLEWAIYNGRYYGTPKAPVEAALAAGKTVLLEIDVQGALAVRAAYPQARLVFVAPPDLPTLATRLQYRGDTHPEEMEQRLAIAVGELAQREAFDTVVVNDTVETASETLWAWVHQLPAVTRAS